MPAVCCRVQYFPWVSNRRAGEAPHLFCYHQVWQGDPRQCHCPRQPPRSCSPHLRSIHCLAWWVLIRSWLILVKWVSPVGMYQSILYPKASKWPNHWKFKIQHEFADLIKWNWTVGGALKGSTNSNKYSLCSSQILAQIPTKIKVQHVYNQSPTS